MLLGEVGPEVQPVRPAEDGLVPGRRLGLLAAGLVALLRVGVLGVVHVAVDVVRVHPDVVHVLVAGVVLLARVRLKPLFTLKSNLNLAPSTDRMVFTICWKKVL